MKTEIYFFSGTGNSLFVARELQNRIPDSAVLPIVSMLSDDIIRTNAGIAGLVFPVHALTIPIAVKQFIRKLDVRSTQYIFAVATREGTVFRGFEKINRMLGKKGRHLDAQFILEMCNSDARHGKYIVPSEPQIKAVEKTVLKRLDEIGRIIISKTTVPFVKDRDYPIPTAPGPVKSFFIEKLVLSGISIAEYIGGVNYFYCDDRCTGCGICEKVCLSQKIMMDGDLPVWRKNILCYMCFACLNYCPQTAVQIHDIPGVKSYSKENGRYPHPYASVLDIAAQKTGRTE